MSRCRWLKSPRSAGSPRRRPVTSFCMNLRTCWLQTPAMARRGGTRRAKLACCARARGRALVRWLTGEKSPQPSAPRCRRFPNRPKACRPSTTTIGSGGRVPRVTAPAAVPAVARGRQSLLEGRLSAPRLRLSGEGNAQVAGARRAAVSDCRPRQHAARGIATAVVPWTGATAPRTDASPGLRRAQYSKRC